VSAVTLAVAAFPESSPLYLRSFWVSACIGWPGGKRWCDARWSSRTSVDVTCICTDKTGTLTEGRLRLAHLEPAAGIGQERLLRAAATASRPGSGDPLDIAISETTAPVEGSTLATFPFTEGRRREVAVIRTSSGAVLCAAKGAPETILRMSRLTPKECAAWQDKTEEFSMSRPQGYRLLRTHFADRRLDRRRAGSRLRLSRD
jgi:P-type Ca2+ transporter type 2C